MNKCVWFNVAKTYSSTGFKLLFCGHKIAEATATEIPNSFLMKQDFCELTLRLDLVQLLGVNLYFLMFPLLCEWLPTPLFLFIPNRKSCKINPNCP